MKFLKKTYSAIGFVILITTCFLTLKTQATETTDSSIKPYHCEIEIETSNYDENLQALEQTINTYNAEIIERQISIDHEESKQEGMRRNQIVIRVSNQNYHKFLERIGTDGKVVMLHEKVLNAESNPTQDDSQSTICVTVQEISAKSVSVHDVSLEGKIFKIIKFSMIFSLLCVLLLASIWFGCLLLEYVEVKRWLPADKKE